MEMTEGEIARKYRMAKHKDKQVGILADINETSREDIVCILIRAGEAVKPERRKERNRSESWAQGRQQCSTDKAAVR